jgi:hypothetical protein
MIALIGDILTPPCSEWILRENPCGVKGSVVCRLGNVLPPIKLVGFTELLP